jgi:UDP-sugar transporter A1/2/3
MYAEIVKLIISLTSLFSEYHVQKNSAAPLEFQPMNFLGAAVPAVLYLITNNLNFFVIKEIGALSFQILNNLKIVTAAILFQVRTTIWDKIIRLLVVGIFNPSSKTKGTGAPSI